MYKYEILKDKQYKQYNTISRYSASPIYYNTNDDKYITGFSKNLLDTTQYRVHEIKKGDTFDSLALYYYNNPTYYWIICDFNRVQDPFTELKVGEKIKIPTFSAIEFEE